MEQQRDQHHGRENLDGGEKGAASPSMLSRMQHQARSIDAHAALRRFGGGIVFCHHTISRGQGFGEAVGSGRHRRRDRA